MTITTLLSSIAALVLVLALIALVSLLLRKYGNKWLENTGAHVAERGRLDVLAVKPIDAKSKLVIVKCDEKQYLLCVQPDGCVVIDEDVKRI